MSTPEQTQLANPSIQRATASVESARAKAEADATRPTYHFRPIANWMNDPNGTIYANGYYQLFFQHNPYGDEWGHMHWGHARSRDLVHWEHLPIALWPSLELGEEHVFSGCAAINGEGQPMLFYTMVGPGTHGERPANEQWAALGDESWVQWEKHPQNPILSLDSLGTNEKGELLFTEEWRDPYIFTEGGRTFLVIGAATKETAGVPIYEAVDGSLAKWNYLKLLIAKPTSELPFFECPNFFKVPDAAGGTKWIFLTSPYAPVRYIVGQFDVDNVTFTQETEGVLDAGHSAEGSATYYATNTLYDDDGRCVLLGWIRGFEKGLGWNGCLALPRTVTVGEDGHPRQLPVPEVDQLRQAAMSVADFAVDNAQRTLDGVGGPAIEVQLMLQLDGAQRAGVWIGQPNNAASEIAFDGTTLTVAGTVIPRTLSADHPLALRFFIDHSTLELFVNDGEVAVSRLVTLPLDDVQIGVFAEGGAAKFSAIQSWQMASIW